MKKLVVVGLALALIAALLPILTVSADSVNVIKNGSFEEEFVWGVGKYWNAFNNGGLTGYGYHDDTWNRTVFDGKYSALLEIHTSDALSENDKDRYTGLYQVVDVVPGSRYMFSFYGMLRSTAKGEIKKGSYNYRVEVGYDYNGGTDPWAVTEWEELNWPEYERENPRAWQSYAHGVTPTGNKLTVFIRVHKKFPTTMEEADINLDAVSLLGPAPTGFVAAATPAAETPTIPKTGAGDALPLVGLALAIAAIGLTTTRLLKRNQ